MKITKVINKNEENANSVKDDRRAIPEEELKKIVKINNMMDSEETADLVSDEEYEAANHRVMTDEEIERFQKRYLDSIEKYKRDYSVMDFLRGFAARCFDEIQHPECYDLEDYEDSDGWRDPDHGLGIQMFWMAYYCGLADDIDLEEIQIMSGSIGYYYNKSRQSGM